MVSLVGWQHFVVIYGDGCVPSIGKKIEGKVQENVELGVKTVNHPTPSDFTGMRASFSLECSGGFDMAPKIGNSFFITARNWIGLRENSQTKSS